MSKHEKHHHKTLMLICENSEKSTKPLQSMQSELVDNTSKLTEIDKRISSKPYSFQIKKARI